MLFGTISTSNNDAYIGYGESPLLGLTQLISNNIILSNYIPENHVVAINPNKLIIKIPKKYIGGIKVEQE
jgi:hypothetical protein